MAESSTAVASGSVATNVDIWLVYSYLLGINVARQALAVADPNNALNVAAVQPGIASGAESGLVVKLAPNSGDLTAILQAQQATLMELQNLVTLLGGFPVTSGMPMLSGVNQTQ
jgi:hypothetical protein